MILEDATFEGGKYYPKDLLPQSTKKIWACCFQCGKFKITSKNVYCYFCNSCSQKLGGKSEGKHNPNYQGGSIKCFCLKCGKEFETTRSRLMEGKGKYCSPKCFHNAYSGENHYMFGMPPEKTPMFGMTGNKNPNFGNCLSEETKARIGAANYKHWEKISWAKHQAKRKQQLGYTLLLSLKEGEEGHHITDEYVIGIPKEVHQRLSGYSRKKHRTKVLMWLKENDKKKYKIVLCVLAKEL